MIERWQGRLVNAHLERWGIDGSHPLAPFVSALVVRRRDRARSLVLSSRVARRVRRAAIATAVAGLAVFVGLVVLVSQLL